MGNYKKAIDYLIQRIVQEIHPLRIILFGSAAREDNRNDSDIDMLVIVPEGVHRRHTAQSLSTEGISTCILSCEVLGIFSKKINNSCHNVISTVYKSKAILLDAL